MDTKLAGPVTLSESAVAVLRLRMRGHKLSVADNTIDGYRELAAAGLMEPVDGEESGFRFTPGGMEHRDEIQEREQERIERERHEPPEATRLSRAAKSQLRRHLAGDDLVTEWNRPAYRELVAARIMIPLSGFATGPEARFIFTYWGWEQRYEFAELVARKNLRDRMLAWLRRRGWGTRPVRGGQ